MFECTILLGSLATGAGMFFHCGLPSLFPDKALQDPRFTDDKFGIIFLNADPSSEDAIKAILHETGAIEVTTGDDTVYEVQMRSSISAYSLLFLAAAATAAPWDVDMVDSQAIRGYECWEYATNEDGQRVCTRSMGLLPQGVVARGKHSDPEPPNVT